MIDPVLSLKDVHLALDGNAGRVEILHGISLDVAKGASIGLIGPSGSGKTVVLNFLLAQARKYDPRIIFFDKDRGAELFIRGIGGRYAPWIC